MAIRSLKEQIMGRCAHYEAPMDHDRCAAGVEYQHLRDTCGGTMKWPCFERNGSRCASAKFPTEAEADAEIEESNRSIKRIFTARAAIVASKLTHGAIACPVCGAAGALRFSVSSYNGHIHAGCRTTGCVSWME